MRRIYFIVSLLVVAVVAMAAVYECDKQNTTDCLYIPGSGTDIECRGPGGGGGGGGLPTAVPTASPTPTALPASEYYKAWGGEYSYGDTSNCRDGQRIDPIGIVFRIDGFVVTEHANHHGLTVNADGDQRFFNAGSCSLADINAASNDGKQVCFPTLFCPKSRWHIRGKVVSVKPDLEGGPQSSWAVGTPHYDEAIGVTCWHAVTTPYRFAGDGFPPGPWNPDITGFTAGQIKVGDDFQRAGHRYMGSQYWANLSRMKQCTKDANGDPEYTGGNGFIDMYRMR